MPLCPKSRRQAVIKTLLRRALDEQYVFAVSRKGLK
jgi:hypothetical protein